MRIDISDQLTPEFFKDAHKGQVLKFNDNGKINSYKIVRLNKAKRICIMEPTQLYTEEEFDVLMNGEK